MSDKEKRDVWFSPDAGIYYLISENRTSEEAWSDIYAFVKDHNYKIPYVRTWEEYNMRWYDVGSHSEFFVWVYREDVENRIISEDSL